MKTYEDLRDVPGLRICELGTDGGMGELWRAGKPWATVIWSFGGGWEHVSIRPIKKSHTPMWWKWCGVWSASIMDLQKSQVKHI